MINYIKFYVSYCMKSGFNINMGGPYNYQWHQSRRFGVRSLFIQKL